MTVIMNPNAAPPLRPPPFVEAMVESRLLQQNPQPQPQSQPPPCASRGEPSTCVEEQHLLRSRHSHNSLPNPHKTPSKARSLSDSTPQLSPSPKFREPSHRMSANPRTPRRPDPLSSGLSIQVGMPSPANFGPRVPLSPQLDARNTYASSPISLLPRRSRGAEFTRACTNLHHSTLADKSSPDSSPTITQKGMAIPSRNARASSMAMDSPNMNTHSNWSSIGYGDRTAASSSVGSINMLGSSSSSSSDEDDPMDENDDPMLLTPQVRASQGVNTTPTLGGGSSATMFSTGGIPSFMNLHRARLRKGRSRKSSSSASGHSSLVSPGPASPPLGKGMENGGGGFFAREIAMRNGSPRRESFSMSANDLRISSGNDSGDDASGAASITPGVVRRPVTRRGNLLPKSRQFGRIKAELQEESAPVDSEVRREAEIIRQVRESDTDLDRPGQCSPSLIPTAGLEAALEGVPEEGSENGMSLDSSAPRASYSAFNAGGSGKPVFGRWWNHSDNQAHTPPPPIFARAGSSAVSDVSMDSPSVSSASNSLTNNAIAPLDTSGWYSRASTPQPMAPLTAAEGLKKSNKRRRDDDLDINSIKRRAVSPGVSVQNSPILSQSPGQRDGSLWGNSTRTNREGSNGGHGSGERSNSTASISATPSLGPKRIGLQGMTDTNDSLMKMSIE